jgi:large subunit ribosomal protein L19
MSRIRLAESPYLRPEEPEFRVGDTVDVATKIVEGDKERIQVFHGLVIRRRGGGLAETFTVRRIVHGEGVERIFPLHSPRVASVKVLRRGSTRRSKLYYLRDRVGKATRLREVLGFTAESDADASPAPAQKAAEGTPKPAEKSSDKPAGKKAAAPAK